MHYKLKVAFKLQFLVLSFFVSQAFAEVEKCDPESLRRIPNLSYYWTDKVNIGETLKLTCARPYGIPVGTGRFDSSFSVRCESDGKFSGIRECQMTCDMASVLKASFKYDLGETYNLTTQDKVSASKLVGINNQVKIKCLPAHYIEELSTSQNEVKEYTYRCGSNDPVYKCKEKEVVFDIKPPKSNISGDYTPIYNCNLNQLVLQNAKITGVTNASGSRMQKNEVSSVLTPRSSVEVTCEKGDGKTGYAAHYGMAAGDLGPKLTQKFTVTCDPEGTGKFIGVKACASKCDATTLIKSSAPKNNANAVLTAAFLYNSNNLNNSIGTLRDKNVETETQYIDRGMAIKVQCKEGYEIRKTMKDHYFSHCSSIGFSDLEVCEPQIKPCNNSEISLNGSKLQPHKNYNATTGALTGTTAPGMQLDVKCQGGDIYFAKGNNPQGIPRCVYDERTGQSAWNVRTFNCFNGCIDQARNIEKPVGKHGTIKKRIRRVYAPGRLFVNLYSTSDIRPGISASPSAPKYDTAEDFVRGFMIDSEAKIPDILENYAARRLSYSMHPNNDNVNWSDNHTGRSYQIGFMIFIETNILSCPERQIDLQEYTLDYKLFRSSMGTHATNGHDRRSVMPFGVNWNGGCGTHVYWDGHRGDSCMGQLKRTYNGSESWEEQNLNSSSINLNLDNRGICESILNIAVPIPISDHCKGWGEYHVKVCNDYRSDPIIVQSASCKVRDTTPITKSSYYTTYGRGGDATKISFY